MYLFKISFQIGNKIYSALIHRVEADIAKDQLTLYTTHEIEPALPIQMITFAAVSLDRLRWQVPNDQIEAAKAIAVSILNEVKKLGIPLSDNPYESTSIVSR